MFTWIAIHKEAIKRILDYHHNETGLIEILQEMEQKGFKVVRLNDEGPDGKSLQLAEIDPFTFMASFNRGITADNRRENWHFVKAKWGLKSAIPDDFDGIPVLPNMNSWFLPYAKGREKGHTEYLWRLCEQAASGDLDHIDAQLFDQCLDLPRVSISNLTIALFWINPEHFLPADTKTAAYGVAKGIDIVPDNFQTYRAWVEAMTKTFGKHYPQISLDAHLFARNAKLAASQPPITTPPILTNTARYWTFSPGEDAEYWQEFQEKGIMAIGWDEMGDLLSFKDKEAIRKKLQELWPGDSSQKNNAHTCWQFAHDLKPGDIIFAKQGFSRLIGYGKVDGDYQYDSTRPYYKHIRRVKWLAAGEWDTSNDKMHMKTLTEVTSVDFIRDVAGKVGLALAESGMSNATPVGDGTSVRYWWLNANPEIWNFEDTPVGQKQTYTSHNKKGNKRQKFKYFQEVKTGDVVVGYVTSPQKEVVAICKITKGLHNGHAGEQIEFEKIEQLKDPVAYQTLQMNPDLANCEPLINNQGSLFKLTEQEYEVIRSLIDESEIPAAVVVETYDKKKAMKGLFLKETQFDEMLEALREKKNLVLQGAPGVGKTYIAKRLAYALIGSNDPRRVETIQFHQSYSYEDFIQGFRPTLKGHFDLKYGIFYQFCRRAQRDEAKGEPYVFLIDEINRGNLSKIFGELMMLIEPDKRGREHGIPLAYSEDSEDRFYIPENVHLIGMMNTADRSLAMVDYALRRRFRFITLCPEFATDTFHGVLTDAGATSELVKKIVSRMTALNHVIVADNKNLGSGYQIGHSYFCPRNGVVLDEGWYRRVIENEIVPLIQEYWFDNDQKVSERRAALLG